MILTAIVFLLTLLILILSHEFGHFFVAKKCGIKVLEFGFGLPPRAWGKKIGETIYSLNWLPIGGFVRLLGEDEVDKKILDDKRSFPNQPVWQRIAVVTAGVTMNLLLAIILFYIILIAQGFKEEIPLLTDFTFQGVNQTNVNEVLIGLVAPGSPAEAAGIKAGDRVIALDGQSLQDSKQLVDLTKQHLGQSVQLTLVNPEENTRTVTLTPRENPPQGQGALGLELGSVEMAKLSYDTPTQKIFSAFSRSYNLTAYSLQVLGGMISTAFQTKNITPVSDSVAGPVGLTSITGTIVHTQNPLLPYLNFLGLLSLNLAIINIIPFPALDGGRLVFLGMEGIFRKKVKAEIEKWVHTVGMAILLLLILLITFSDISKFFM